MLYNELGWRTEFARTAIFVFTAFRIERGSINNRRHPHQGEGYSRRRPDLAAANRDDSIMGEFFAIVLKVSRQWPAKVRYGSTTNVPFMRPWPIPHTFAHLNSYVPGS